jgi:hypothetical protein
VCARHCCSNRRPVWDDISPADLTGNFWEIGKYKVALKRINTGAKLCDEFVKMVNERCGALPALEDFRAAIEKQYAKNLLQWAEKWEEKLRTNGEYGTTANGWRAIFTEARGLSDIHSQVKVLPLLYVSDPQGSPGKRHDSGH